MDGEATQATKDAEPTDLEEDLAEFEVVEMQRRAWVRTLIPLIHGCLCDSDASPKLRDQHEGMQIAAMRRLVRELNSDIAG